MKVKIVKSSATKLYFSFGYVTEGEIYNVTSKMNGRYYIEANEGDIIWFYFEELEFVRD